MTVRDPLHLVAVALDGVNARLANIERSLRTIHHQEAQEMSQLDDLRQVQTDEGAALTALLQTIADETAQVAADLDGLVAAQGNAVTDDDVQSARDHLAKLQALTTSVEEIDPT